MSLTQFFLLAYFKRLLKTFSMFYNKSRKISLPLPWESLCLLLAVDFTGSASCLHYDPHRRFTPSYSWISLKLNHVFRFLGILWNFFTYQTKKHTIRLLSMVVPLAFSKIRFVFPRDDLISQCLNRSNVCLSKKKHVILFL